MTRARVQAVPTTGDSGFWLSETLFSFMFCPKSLYTAMPFDNTGFRVTFNRYLCYLACFYDGCPTREAPLPNVLASPQLMFSVSGPGAVG